MSDTDPLERPYALSTEQSLTVREQLAERGAWHDNCTRCEREGTMTILPVVLRLELASVAEAITGKVAEQSVPTSIVICTNCGWLAIHALGALGLKDLMKPWPGDE